MSNSFLTILQATDKEGTTPLHLVESNVRFLNTLKAAAAGDMDVDDIL